MSGGGGGGGGGPLEKFQLSESTAWDDCRFSDPAITEDLCARFHQPCMHCHPAALCSAALCLSLCRRH